MKIIVSGSLGNVSKPLTTQLVAAGHHVTVITSDAKKADAIVALGAQAAIGSVTDAEFLTGVLESADAVYAMLPPSVAATDLKATLVGIGRSYADAIKASGVKKVVLLSSIGAHLPSGTGPIAALHEVEKLLNALEGVTVISLRAASFYLNYYANVGMIKGMGIIGGNIAADRKMVLVHPKDIAEAAAKALQSNDTGKQIYYVVSDERTTTDVAKVLGKAIGKPDLQWIQFTDDQAYQGMVQAGLPPEAARNYTEMNSAVNSGVLWEDYLANRPSAVGKVKLEDYAEEFAHVYNAG